MKPRSQMLGKMNMIGATIVKIRVSKGIKQKDLLAQLQLAGIEISATSLSRLEGQHRIASDFEVVAISAALDIDVRELLGLCVKYDMMDAYNSD